MADPKKGRWLAVALLWWVCFFNYADRQAIFSVFPLLSRDLHLGPYQLGFVGSAFMWMYALTGPVAGRLCDRFSRKWIIVIALTFWSVVTGATAFVHTLGPLIALRALSGLGEAFYFPAALSLLADYHGPDTRSRALAFHQSGVYVGTVAGGGLAAWIAERSGWHQSFAVFGVGGLVLAVILAAYLRQPHLRHTVERVPETLSLGKQLLRLTRNRRAQLLVCIFIGANFVASCFLTWLPTYLYQRWHLNVASAGLQATIYVQVASILGVLLGGLLADRMSRKRRGGRMRTQAIGLFLGAPFLLLFGGASALSLVVIALVGFGLAKGIYDSNIWASLYDTVREEERGFAAGLMNSLGWIGGGLAPLYVAGLSGHMGMGHALGDTGWLYLVLGALMALLASRFARR